VLRIAAIEDPAWRRHFNALANSLEVFHGAKGTRDAERVCGCQLYTALELFEGRPVEGIALDLDCSVRTVQRWIKDDLLEGLRYGSRPGATSAALRRRGGAVEERPETEAAAPVDLREFRARRAS
jgi:hypothetical protein